MASKLNRKFVSSLSALAVAGSLVALSSAAFAGDYERFPEFSNTGSSVSRAEVRDQAAAALRAGELHAGDYQSPVHWSDSGAPGLTRVQVAAEAREAVRLGVTGGGELYQPPTQLQEWQIHMAGLRALQSVMAQAAQ